MSYPCKYKVSAYASAVALAFCISMQAQFGGIKTIGNKVKDAAVGGVNGVASGVSGKRSGDKGSREEGAHSSGASTKLKDGEPAEIQSSLSAAKAMDKVKAYFNGKDIDFTVNADTARLVTDWYGERRCGPGFNHCANKAMVRVAAEDGKTVLRIQVIQRKRETGLSDKPWRENTTSKGKETGELADALREVVGEAR